MKNVKTLQKAIEAITKLEDVEFVDFDGNSYYFIGYNYDEGKEVEIELKVFTRAFVIKKNEEEM